MESPDAFIDAFIDKLVETKQTAISVADLTPPDFDPSTMLLYMYKICLTHRFLSLFSDENNTKFTLALNTKITRCMFYPSCTQDCKYIHGCKYFLTTLKGGCTKGRRCAFDHDLKSEHNLQAAKFHGADKVKIRTLKKILFITDFETGHMLRLCEGCMMDKDCQKVHACFYFVASNSCRFGEKCHNLHSVVNWENKDILKKHGFESVCDDDMLAYMKAIYGEPSFTITEPTTQITMLSSANAEKLAQMTQKSLPSSIAPENLKCTFALRVRIQEIFNSCRAVNMVNILSGQYPVMSTTISHLFNATISTPITRATSLRRIDSPELASNFAGVEHLQSQCISEYWGFYGIRFQGMILRLSMYGFSLSDEKSMSKQKDMIAFRASMAHEYTTPGDKGQRRMMVVRCKLTGPPKDLDSMVPIVQTSDFYPEFLITYGKEEDKKINEEDEEDEEEKATE
ncbi:hypothetical protein ACOME3_001978 [Neoechinorhynchus agilis]